MKDKRLKRGLAYIAFAALLYFIIKNFNYAILIIESVFSVLTPFIYGFLIAYILKFPYNFFLDKVYKGIGKKNPKFIGIKRPLSVISTYVSAILVIVFLMLIIVPSLADSFSELSKSLPAYARSFEVALNQFVDWVNSTFNLKINLSNGIIEILHQFTGIFTGGDLGKTVNELASKIFPQVIVVAKNVYTGAYNWIIGIVASIYFLSCKDTLCRQVRKITTAYAPKKHQEKIFEVTRMSNEVCGNFIIGRVIDSLIMGILCYIVLTVFRFDYALLISVIVGVTNVIPFFGPFLGAIPSGFLLLMIDPTECLWFVVVIVALQQLDGNLIGPKVIGDKIGISGLWILFSVIVGSGLFGIAGMLLGVPAFVVIYNLLGKDINKKLLRTKEYISKKPLKGPENTEEKAEINQN